MDTKNIILITVFLFLTVFKLRLARYYVKTNQTELASLNYFTSGAYFSILFSHVMEFLKQL